MPKIAGTNIAQHIVDQEAAVFGTATRLFTERGVDNVSMGTIADAVGLARPSLYRYFPRKSSIVIRWFVQAMDPLVAESRAIARSGDDRSVRFDRWIDCQITFLLDASNRAMIRATLATDDLDDAGRRVIGEQHRDLYATLQSILTDQPVAEPPDNTSGGGRTWVRVMLIVDLLRGLDQLTSGGISAELARAEVLRAARLIAGVCPG